MSIYPDMEGTDAPLTPIRPFLINGKQLEIGPNKVTKLANKENGGYIIFLQYPGKQISFSSLNDQLLC